MYFDGVRMIFVVGVNLAGPANYKETAIAWLKKKILYLSYLNSLVGADDRVIFDLVSNISRTQETVIGLDAPLQAANIGGGDSDGMLNFEG